MAKKNPRIDTYIEDSAPFAQPILKRLRKVMHEACPEVEENIKWSMPFFDYKSQPLANMAAFKQHAAFGFWKQKLMRDPKKLFSAVTRSMGSLGDLKSVKDLPSDAVLKAYIKEAMRLNDEGIKAPVQRKFSKPKRITVPKDLASALKKNVRAKTTFESFPPSHKREYIEWITSAKQKETRQRRLAKTLAQLAKGQSINWKYEAKMKRKK